MQELDIAFMSLTEALGVAEHRADALSRVFLGGMQEAAQLIERSDDPESARNELADAILWAFWAMHRQANEDARRSKT